VCVCVKPKGPPCLGTEQTARHLGAIHAALEMLAHRVQKVVEGVADGQALGLHGVCQAVRGAHRRGNRLGVVHRCSPFSLPPPLPPDSFIFFFTLGGRWVGLGGRYGWGTG
jgi:hypothetical protein